MCHLHRVNPMNAPETTTIANPVEVFARCPLAEPRRAAYARAVLLAPEGIELRQPFGSKQRSESAKRFSVALLARGHDRQRGNSSDQ